MLWYRHGYSTMQLAEVAMANRTTRLVGLMCWVVVASYAYPSGAQQSKRQERERIIDEKVSQVVASIDFQTDPFDLLILRDGTMHECRLLEPRPLEDLRMVDRLEVRLLDEGAFEINMLVREYSSYGQLVHTTALVQAVGRNQREEQIPVIVHVEHAGHQDRAVAHGRPPLIARSMMVKKLPSAIMCSMAKWSAQPGTGMSTALGRPRSSSASAMGSNPSAFRANSITSISVGCGPASCCCCGCRITIMRNRDI